MIERLGNALYWVCCGLSALLVVAEPVLLRSLGRHSRWYICHG